MKIREQLEKQVSDYIGTQQGTVAVAFYDLEEKTGFSIHGEKRVPSASTIKLVIMAEVMRRVRTGELSLDAGITVTEEMKTGGDGILKELMPGHVFTLREILTLMIIVSDNEATNILVNMLGMEAVNQMAGALGLKAAVLGRRMMDSEAKKKGHDNYICADDIAKIYKMLWEGTCIDEEASAFMLDVLKRQQQSGRLQLYLPEEVEVAHKCGDLDFLENDGGIIFLPGHPYILVVLTSDMKSNKEGREVIGEISRMIYNTLVGACGH